MGKTIAEESPTNMTKLSPTVEQLRLAKMLSNSDRSCDLAAAEKCQELARLTGCSDLTALAMLNDCDTFQEAVEKILDQNLNEHVLNEWQTTGKRSRKSHNKARGDAENQNLSQPHESGGNVTTVCNGDEQNHESTLGDQHQRLNNGFGGMTGASGFRRRQPPDGSRDPTRPPRGRGRGGFSSRGGRPRGRDAFESTENQNGGDTMDSFDERTTEGRGGFRGRRGFQSSYRAGGRGSYRSSGPRRHNDNDTGFSSEGNTWSNETESNTWDNSMAGKWSGPKSSNNDDHHNRERPPAQGDDMVVDEWKNTTTTEGGSKHNSSFNNAENNTWDNSMAQNVVQPNNQYRRKDNAAPENYRNRDSYGRQSYNKHSMGARNDGNRDAQKDEWNSDDWTGEDVDWKKMNRVYVNQQQNSQTTKLHQPSQSSANSIPSPSPQQQQSSNQLSVTSQPNATASQSPRGSNAFTGPSSQTHEAQKHATTAILENTGIGSHVRGESIDVNLLFGQKSGETGNEAAGGQWNKQAADAIKNELGIGRTLAQNGEQMQRGQHPFPTSKPTTSKVEMPSSVPMIGKIDVEFGEFSSASLKLRPNMEEKSNNYYEFGTATSFMSSDLVRSNENNTLNACSQTTNPSLYQRTPSKEQVPMELSLNSSVQSSLNKENSTINNQKNALKQNDISAPVDLLYGGAGSVPSSSAFIRSASNSTASTAAVSEQYHQAQTQTGATAQQQTQQSAAATASSLNSNRSPSILQNKSQQSLTGQQAAGQHGQPQRSYISSGVQSSADNSKETAVNPSTITLPSTQPSMNYNNSVNRTVTTSATAKPQISTATIFNPATNPSYQALAAAAAMPYIYPPAEQNYLNALQFLQGPTAGYPFSALGTLPFDIASLTLRDTQQSAANDGKQFSTNRTDGSMSGTGAANTSINAPPGLGPATVQNAEQQAAQLLTPAAAAAAYTHPYQLMQAAPFYAPFVVPNVTNSSASTVNTVNQFNKNFASAQPMFYGSGDMQMAQDYTKSLYGVNITGQPPSQNKQGSAGTNLGINANDAASKGYSSNTLKMFDGKNFQQNTATPPPGIGNVNFPPGAAAAFHSSNVNAAAAAAAAAAYGPYAQFLPHQINMLPPNIAAQAQTVNPNDVLNSAGQRGTAGGNKAGPNVYSTTKNNAYWAN